MNGHGWSIRFLMATCFWPLAALAAAQTNDAEAQWRSMQEDAELHDVCFIDERNGWAVGDRGVIWHTTDAGQHWQLQPSGVGSRLASVTFVDEKRGWAVGSQHQPVVHHAQAVIVRTVDGGATWQQVPAALLSAPERVKFFDAAHGIMFGAGTALQPSGISDTEDGGRSWSPVPGGTQTGWLGGDFADPHNGILVGDAGAIGLVRRRQLEISEKTSFGLRRLHQVYVAPPVNAWMVGDGGVVQFSQDLGKTWLTPFADPLPVSSDQFDWRAVAVRGNKVWIAGEPGTRILHTADGGRSWQTMSTGSHVPLHAIHFVDDERGWAVGALGTILATADGGRTWSRQHAGGVRSAILVLVAEPNDLPLELLARLSANEGYLAAADFIVRRDLEPGDPQRGTLEARAAAAMNMVGGSAAESAWQFPLRQPGLAPSAEQIMETWNLVHDGHGLEALEARLVRAIRTWRPELVVTHGVDPRGQKPLDHLLNQVVLRAVEQANDATMWPAQAAQMGLEPWRVKKVVGAMGDGQLGSLSVPGAQFAVRMGTTVGDLAAEARSLVNDGSAAPVAAGFQMLIDALPQGGGGNDFMAGISLQPGGEARRQLPPTPDQTELLRRVAQKRRNLQAIIAQETAGDADATRLTSHVSSLTQGLDERSAADLLFQLATRYADQGRWTPAADMHQLLVSRYPQHRLAPASLLWLLRYNSSGEIAWQIERAEHRAASAVNVQAGVVIDPARRGTGKAIPLEAPGMKSERQAVFVRDTPGEATRAQRATAAAQQLEQVSPALFSEPAVQFPLAAVHRAQGLPRQADRFFLGFARGRAHDAWWSCAAGEQWLTEPKGECPKEVCNAAVCQLKPKLDGKLDDAVWRNARPVKLSSLHADDSEWPAQAQVAYDDEFLYLAVRCRRAPGVKYDASSGTRPRDPDLASHDRVEFLIDIDRDFATSYRLVIDQRGWACDSLWMTRQWDPEWFVAAGGDEEAWVAEAAIPFAALVPQRPASRFVWALGVQRVAPGIGFQSWNAPASTAVLPEGFGYLIFD